MSQTGVGERFDSALGFGRPCARGGFEGPSQDVVTNGETRLGTLKVASVRTRPQLRLHACVSPAARSRDGHLLPLVGFAAGSIPAGESSVTLMSEDNTDCVKCGVQIDGRPSIDYYHGYGSDGGELCEDCGKRFEHWLNNDVEMVL